VWRLLFVGANALWLRQIERDLHCLQPTWRCRCVEDADQAAAGLASAPFEAMILDGHVAGGGELVQRAGREFPKTICLVRCDLIEAEVAAQWSHTGATLLAEETSATTLVASLKRIAQIREWLANPALKKLLGLIRKLPTAPKLHTEVTNELRSPTGSFEIVARLIAQEPVMSAKILQVVNSAFFGLPHEVTDTSEAVMVLGADRIKGLILLAGVFSQYAGAKCPGFSPEPVWTHSAQVASFARAIALGETRDARTADAAFTAGLLHDIGKLVLAGNLPDLYENIRRLQAARKCPQRDAEDEVMGTTHAELGACLLATWGLPPQILEAIAWHHHPECSAAHGFSLLAAVHCANVFAQEVGGGGGGAGARDRVNIEYLLNAGLGDCRARWRVFCGVAPNPEEESEEERLRRRREAKQN
jgi:putative nucleotidyltransferase with HDIG domain